VCVVVVVLGDERSEHFVPSDGQRFGEKVDQVFAAGHEDDTKLTMIDAITKPLEVYVQGFAHLRSVLAIGEPDRTLVVAVDGRWRLRMAKVGEDVALFDGDASSGIELGRLF
jgi:hypothetical protein